jgi:magnesium chelatase family protein
MYPVFLFGIILRLQIYNLSNPLLWLFCQLQDEGQSLMRSAISQLQLSARAYHRILKLARTIADLAGGEEIQSVHLVEALQYHPKIIMG